MKFARFTLLVALLVAAVGVYQQPPVAAQEMCALIDIYESAQPADGGEGMGAFWQGYLAEGTVIEYYMNYEGPGGGRIMIWLGDPDPGNLVYSDDGPAPVSGSYTVTTAGNYSIDAGASTDQQAVGAMVRVLVEATCQGDSVDLMCERIASQSGLHCVMHPDSQECMEETGFCVDAYVAAGTVLTLVAESENPACPVEGNIHFGEGFPLAQARGIGAASATILAPESGTYSFCAGGIWYESPCAGALVTLTAYSGCEISVAAGCPALMNMPKTAVVGAFVADARAHWKPGMMLEPEVVLQAGKTAWVLGMDATGAYYKIVWNCDYLWVPVSSMGPNYDGVWNGTPLPTGVVQ